MLFMLVSVSYDSAFKHEPSKTYGATIMYVKQATLTNFQCHKKTVLNFHQGVNVIIGETDRGKSAILRAIGWNIRNRSEDRGFRSRWGGKTDVELVFTDEKEVSRVQDKHNAYYLVDPVNNLDEEYKAFKTDIPEDIVKALNLSNINIQSQFDPPFLLAENAGDVAKLLNKIANLTDIDTSISNIRKLVLANNREIGTLEIQILELTEQEASFEYLTQMEIEVAQYEKLCKQDALCDSEHFALGVIISNIEKCNLELNEIEAFLKAEAPCNAVLALTEQQNAIAGQIRAIESSIAVIAESEKSIIEINTFLEAEPQFIKVDDMRGALTTYTDEISGLERAISRILTDEGQLRTIDKNLDSYTMEFEALMPNSCPLCGK